MVGVRKRHKGKIYLSVSGAAASLGTNAAKIKQLMSDGTLDWCNLRVDTHSAGVLVAPLSQQVRWQLSNESNGSSGSSKSGGCIASSG
jgi:hypothetical protein